MTSDRAARPTSIHLVPHTHWDREWYRPFQSFRMQLVDLVDRVLDMLEAEPGFAFTLDGQLATIDDYLEIRPDQADRIRRHVESGRLAIGPWQILMDEFLVSGETLVRNLEMGWARAEDLGGPMPIGYLPDMFGHVAQMPQLLRAAGVADAVVWRGVPASIDSHRFRWESPDGSWVRAEYMPSGYGNAAGLFAVPDQLDAAAERFLEFSQPWFDGDPVLAMYGTDHTAPVPELAGLVSRLNEVHASASMRIATLAQYLDRAPELRVVVTQIAGLAQHSGRHGHRCVPQQHLVDAPAVIGRDPCPSATRLNERIGPWSQRREFGRVDRRIEVAHEHGRRIVAEGGRARLGLEPALAGADLAEMGGPHAQAVDGCQHQAAGLADPGWRIAVADAGGLMTQASRLDEGINAGARQRECADIGHRTPREERVPEEAGTDDRVAIGHVEGPDGAVGSSHVQLPREVADIVDERPAHREDRHLLQCHDVDVQPGQNGADRPEAIGVDAAPPAVRKRTRPDGGADVPGDDAERRHPYFTEPASRPWTK